MHLTSLCMLGKLYYGLEQGVSKYLAYILYLLYILTKSICTYTFLVCSAVYNSSYSIMKHQKSKILTTEWKDWVELSLGGKREIIQWIVREHETCFQFHSAVLHNTSI